jgi:hypothetical protein
MIIGPSVLITSIASQLYDRFKATGLVPVPDTFQYLGMTVTEDRSKRSIAIDQIGYTIRVLDRFEMTDCRMAHNSDANRLQAACHEARTWRGAFRR